MQGTSRSISVEVYPTTPAGRAVLTIVGELDHEKFIGTEPLTPELLAQLNIETDPIFTGDVSIAQAVANNFFIPEAYRGVYNVKFNKVLNTLFAFFKSRFPVGSSAKIILGLLIIARAIATL